MSSLGADVIRLLTMPTPSGAWWVSQFPGSHSTDELAPDFQAKFSAFLSAMQNSGLQVTITATLRPPQRAYLMHWAWMIVQGQAAPPDVPPMAGVDILWDHPSGLQGAKEMVDGYEIQNLQVPPALNSRHTQGLAVDTEISWDGNVDIIDGTGNTVTLVGTPRDSTNRTLIEVGSTYGVIHLEPPEKDRVHWSNDGH